MRRFFASLGLALTLTLTTALGAGPLHIDGQTVDAAATVRNNTTYVSLRAEVETLRPDAAVFWSDGQAAAEDSGLSLTARPGNLYLEVNGRALYIPQGVLLENGRTLVPVRVLADALGAAVDWNSTTGAVTVTSGGGAPTADEVYDPDAVLWLSRIISAESRGESLLGKIAVGNVVLNRVAHAEFPATIYGVIFDERWGGQFEPVRNGTVYQTPTDESVIAAKLTLEGADVARDSLYFLAPSLTDNHWIMENRDYVMTIGVHHFYR